MLFALSFAVVCLGENALRMQGSGITSHLFFLHTLGGVPMVRQKMPLARLNPLKRLWTGSALVWPHVGMDSMVSLHIVHPCKRQTAIRAGVGLLAQVCCLVRL
jgi:hypothetical protein